jgi:hypothetical protein
MCAGSTRSIEPDEAIIRRIPKCPGYYDPLKNPPIERGAFTPNKNDKDGLSCFLEREMSAEDLLARSNQPGSNYVIVRFRAADLFQMGLSLIRTNDPDDLPGHVVIPEINFQDYKDPRQKPRLKELGKALVDLARHNIVASG